jgi:hypothetical protein
VNFLERRLGEVRRIYLLGTRAELFDDAVSAETQRHIGQTVQTRGSGATPPAMPCTHLQHTDTRDEALTK